MNVTYKLIKKLGEGAFGEVHKAKTPEQEKFYQNHPVTAIKITKNYRTDLVAAQEAKLLKRLNHKNIVKYLTSFVINGNLNYRQFAIVMEYCDFGDMNNIIPSEPDEGTVWRFMNIIANGLNYIHNQNIVHRDLKPENILCRSDGMYTKTWKCVNYVNVKIGDFGISKLMTKKSLDNYYTRTIAG